MANTVSCEKVDIAGSWTGSTGPDSTEVCAEWQLRTARPPLPITKYVSSACASPRQDCSYFRCEYDKQGSTNSTPCDDGLLTVSHQKFEALERLIPLRMAAATDRCEYLCPGTEREIECEDPAPPPPPPSPPPPAPPPPFLSAREKWTIAGVAGVAGIVAAIVVAKRGCGGSTESGTTKLEQPLNVDTDTEFTS